MNPAGELAPGRLPAAGQAAGALAAQVLVIAKEPRPGLVKTRLCPPFTPTEAARLAGAALADTLDAVAGAAVHRRVLVLDGSLSDGRPLDGVSSRRPRDGVPRPLSRVLAAGFTVLPQRGDGLDERLAAAYDDAWEGEQLPMLLVGMDTPQLTGGLIEACVTQLLSDGVDGVLGIARDGGWWAMGLRRPDPQLLLGIPMSTAGTGAAQRRRLVGAGLRVVDLPVLIDVDTAAEAWIVAEQAPGSWFAAVLADMAPPAAGSGPAAGG